MLTTWSALCGCGAPREETLRPALGWLKHQWSVGNDHLPLDLVHDLGWMLLLGRDFRFASDRELERWSDEERALRLAYEDRLLGRWALDPTLREAHVALAGLNAQRDEAVAHAVGLALARPLRGLELALGNAAHLKDLDARAAAILQAEEPAPEWLEWARAQRAMQLERLIAHRLFAEEDLWELAHLDRLPSESARLALRELHAAAGRIGRVPAGTALHVQRRAREVPVDAEDADHYPAGGFDAISTQGRFENLVRSEIAYVGQGKEQTGGVDLFDVRFAQNELLYYTRDESPMLDARIELTFVIDRPFELRHKHPKLQAQTLVLVTALLLRLQGDMVDMLGPAGSLVRIEWHGTQKDDLEVAAEERALVELTLGAELAHRRAELGVHQRWRDVHQRGRLIFSPNPEVKERKAKAWVQVGDRRWALRTPAQDEVERFDVSSGEGLRALADRLLVAIFE